MSELQSIFGGGLDVQSNYVEESSGSSLLPDISGAVLMVSEMPEIISNDRGWQGVKFKFLVIDDGAYNGQFKGTEKTYNITIANPSFEDSAKWGKDELIRLAYACGIQTLEHEQQFFQKQFIADIGRKVNKKQTKEAKDLSSTAEPVFDQTYKKLQPIGQTQAPQQQYQQPVQQQYQPPVHQDPAPQQTTQGHNPWA
jgi:hypothetical protein